MKKKIIVLLVVVPPLLFVALFGYLLVRGPRMTVQHHIREFQMIMPPLPPGTVSVTSREHLRLLRPAERAALKNPLQPTAENLAAGRVYYHYYCVFCHGESGAGNGPVGLSYTPGPTDLRSGRLSGDGDLLEAMLTGVGHEPVLERVVPPEHRWHLLLFVRSLQQGRGAVQVSSLPTAQASPVTGR